LLKAASANVSGRSRGTVAALPYAGPASRPDAGSDAMPCPACLADCAAAARFCAACGTALTAGTGAVERRKIAPALFCDITASTALAEAIDVESVRQVMLRYFQAMRQCLERHGGTVEKFIGDAVVGVFGVPLAHEDDALRAVRAALDMRAA